MGLREEREKEFRYQLSQAWGALDAAIELLSDPNGPKRGYYYRVAIDKAYRILTGVMSLEKLFKQEDKRGNHPES